MKKINILLMAMLAVGAMTSCEDAPAVPPIQENPQGPVFEANEVEVSADGALESNTVLSLEQYKASDRIPVLALDPTKGLPEGAEVSFKLELSDTQDFARTSTLETFTDTDSREGIVQYYASTDAWNEAHIYLFGKSPKEKTVYYRVPGYIDLDGADYRIGSLDTYFVSGSLKETCFDMGFVIEDAYYFLSDATTWKLAEATPYKFYHNPDVSPYDDPVFTYTLVLSQSVLDANGGGCWWKIAPQSCVDSGNENGVFGTESDGDTAISGQLTSSHPGAGKLTEAGRYEVTINMESMTYSIKKLVNAIYLVGQPQGWDINSSALAFPETAFGSNIYSGIVKVAAGEFQFRFYSQLGEWNKGSIGSQDDDNPVAISMNENGEYEGDVFQGGVNCNYGKGSWQISGWEGGAVEITVDLNTMKISMKKAEVGGIYLRGDMNGWNAEAAYEFTLTDKVSTWETPSVTIDEGNSFKVADANWGAINMGPAEDSTVMPGVGYPLLQGTNDNFKMGAAFTGKAVLTKVGSAYTLTFAQ